MVEFNLYGDWGSIALLLSVLCSCLAFAVDDTTPLPFSGWLFSTNNKGCFGAVNEIDVENFVNNDKIVFEYYSISLN